MLCCVVRRRLVVFSIFAVVFHRCDSGGSYSVIPRVPGGELTPDQLICMGKVAKKYNLYTKVTGGQRIDLFGAEKHQVNYVD